MTDNVEVTGVLAASMPQTLIDEFKALAKSNERPMSAELRIAMRSHLAEAKRQAA